MSALQTDGALGLYPQEAQQVTGHSARFRRPNQSSGRADFDVVHPMTHGSRPRPTDLEFPPAVVSQVNIERKLWAVCPTHATQQDDHAIL